MDHGKTFLKLTIFLIDETIHLNILFRFHSTSYNSLVDAEIDFITSDDENDECVDDSKNEAISSTG